MKIIAINGSPRKDGNTSFALQTIGSRLNLNGIEFESVQIGHRQIHGCMACGKCYKTKDDTCGIKNDAFNEFIPLLKEADGIMLASPVYFSGIAGTMKCFLDRLFYVSGSNGNYFRHKVGAALAVVRRSGGSSTLDGLNHYLSYAEMQIASSNYWNIVHGHAPNQVHKDDEGVQILEILADNMSWQLKMQDLAKDVIVPPITTRKIMTSFIRE
jgi:Multimeric flavodoxin WrbA